MAKADDKSNTNDKVSTEKAPITDEEIAGLFKPKSHKTRSTDDPQVKHAQRKAVRDAAEKFKAGHRAPRMTSISLREIPEERGLLDQERKQRERLLKPCRLTASSIMPLVVSSRLGCMQESGCIWPLAEVNARENISEG